MKQLILFALTVASSLTYSLNSDRVLAQISLTCPTQGVLTLSGKFDLNTTQQAQCSFVVDNTVSSIGVTINLGTPILISGKPDPPGTNRTAQLIYPNKILNEGSSTTDTFSGGATTTMFLNMQIQRPNQFFAGSYLYGITINITSP
jgi:predicted alpha/beta-hydrolase family hydrolase